MSTGNSQCLKKLGNSAVSGVRVFPLKRNDSVSHTFINREEKSQKSFNFMVFTGFMKNRGARAVDTDIPLGGIDEYIG